MKTGGGLAHPILAAQSPQGRNIGETAEAGTDKRD
jgi:hypothetical protein